MLNNSAVITTSLTWDVPRLKKLGAREEDEQSTPASTEDSLPGLRHGPAGDDA
jgi:hypothetical protein